MAEENKYEVTNPESKTYSEDEYNELARQLETANNTIKSYEDMDVDGIKKSVEDYKQKWEQSDYRNFFKGNLIKDDATFCTFTERASEQLLNKFETEVKKCCCALAENFFKRTLILTDFQNVPKRETIGAYSVSYTNPCDYIEETKQSEKDFRKTLKNIALHYLGNTDLMYRGVLICLQILKLNTRLTG